MYDTVARVICVCYRSTQQDHVFAKHGCIWKGAMVYNFFCMLQKLK
uniref:Uncharacterized protein n=1 Tax=Anguilla anguilla TaxID=7936 RepID=A0A0E9QFF6_ANGAN